MWYTGVQHRATRYQEEQPYCLYSNTVNDLRSAHRKGLLKEGVPRIIEDYAPQGNPNGKRQPLAEYLVNLLNVKDGGTIDTPGGYAMALPAAAPQLISTNREFDAWIEKFKGFPMELQHAVSDASRRLGCLTKRCLGRQPIKGSRRSYIIPLFLSSNSRRSYIITLFLSSNSRSLPLF